ncbi:hypothetical protein CB0940_01133 [Cercospora beticola]|uniref:Nuclear fusion protein KAR5 n=1 Tax=Cercospora beticola TaxID=122368 RepID=A0A2G5IB00_CERBT|nr:hypothetical protein CB0940_01133 [Cercospora beticola]PIB01653.1 hypothetical protein CB0940_01133 [Cercospora beticola]WPA96561.1 hypothetical protein RHO25_001168 [Cercospora beticola]CAK1355103.1 unnamed protein product [Cercospora beticola]
MAVITTLVLSALCAGTVTAGMDWGFGAALVATRAPVNVKSEQSTTSTTFSGTLAEVMAQLEEIRQMPRCKQAAAKDLVHYCATHDPAGTQSAHSTQAELEIYKQLFAIRITHCELESAGQSLPSACDQIVADRCATSECQTGSCLAALFPETNAWTTYMTQTNNGHVMCHAMRAEHDKEEKIRLLKFLIERTSDIGSALEMSQQNLEHLTQTLHDVKHSTRIFYDDMTNSTRDLQSEIKQSFNEIHKDTSGISGVVQSIYSSMDQAKKHLDEYTAEVLHQARAMTAQKDDESREQLAQFQSKMEAVRNVYEYEFQRGLTDLSKQIFALTDSMEIAGAVTGQMLNNFDTLDSHLDNSNQKMGDLLVQMNNASDIQERATAQIQDALDPIVHELQGFRETVGWLIFWPKTIRRTVKFLRGPDVQLFMKSYGLILPFAAMACWIMGSGSAIALLGTCCLALFITMTNSLRVTQDSVDAHASFYCKASPYVVNLAYLVAGAVIATVICRSYFRPKYDPAAQLDPYTGLDDLDIAEQKQNRSRF